jgi:hypothetical protein
MPVEFNHTIVWSRDSKASAIFLARMLGLPAPKRWGPFEVVTTDNGVNIDPARNKPGEVNAHDNGRGVYFEDPSGHLLEIITRPYGSSGWNPS